MRVARPIFPPLSSILPPQLSLLIIAVLLWLPTSVPAQSPDRPWRETLQLDTPLLLAKRWENVRGLIEQQSWEGAIDALSELEAEFPTELVKVSPGRYLGLPLAGRLLRLNLPPEGRDVYRQQIDGWAGQQLETARGQDNPHALQQIVSTALGSSAAGEALGTLAETAWELGDITTARRLWTRMIPADPPAPERLLLRLPEADPDDLAGLHGRLILCSLAEGDLSRAGQELQYFTDRFPDARGHLAGRQGRLVEILEAQLDEFPQGAARPRARSWPTFASRADRNSARHGHVDLGRPLWTLPLDPVYVPRWDRPRPALPERGVLSRWPVTHAGGIFFHNGTTIRGVRLEDGRPLWPVRSGTGEDEVPGKIYPPFPTIPNSLGWTRLVGLPWHTLQVHANRLYGLLGPSVLTVPKGSRPASPMRLVCLDLDDEGLLEWFHIPEDLFDDEWLVTGTPVAGDGRLYVPLLRAEPQIEIGVACLNPEDGTLLWQQTIGQALREPLAGRVELGHQLLTTAQGQVFHATGFGGVAALEARTGRVNWVVTYPSREREAAQRSDETTSGLLPPLYHEGTLYVKPNDADQFLAIDAESGHVHWRRQVPGPIVHLLGARGSDLLASGRHLWAIDLETGEVRWRFGYDDSAGFGYGRGAIVGDRVIWPTREELFLVDIDSGRMHRRLRLYESLGVTGGNIVITDSRLLIAGVDHLTALELHKRPTAVPPQSNDAVNDSDPR